MSSTERESVKKGETLIATPKWFIGIRVAQILVSIIVVGLAGFWIHGAYFDSLGLAIAAGIFTWIVALYAILTERSAGCRSGYNTWAVLSLDFFLIVLWLASLAYNAQFRSIFVTSVDTTCYNDGSAINSNHCSILYKRAASYVATQTGLAILSAIAGLSALLLVFFVITFAYVTHFFRLEWAKHSSTSDPEKASGAVPVAQQQPLQQQQQAQPQWANQPAQYQANAYANQPAAPYDPYAAQQNPGYAGAPGAYPQQVPQPAQVQQHQQHQQHQQQQQQYYPQQ